VILIVANLPNTIGNSTVERGKHRCVSRAELNVLEILDLRNTLHCHFRIEGFKENLECLFSINWHHPVKHSYESFVSILRRDAVRQLILNKIDEDVVDILHK
jgi:hypothetical protein